MISANELLMSLEIGLIYGVVALGIYLTFRVIDFPDLTCDGSFVLGAATSGILLIGGGSPTLSLIGALAAGCLSGLLTGILHTVFKITELLSGILVAFMLYSINLKVMGGVPNISLFQVSTFFSASLIPATILYISIAFLIVLLFKTDLGLALRSIGQNKKFAQNGGVRVERMTILGLMLSNALIALGGALFAHHQGFADVGSGIGTVIVGLASVMIGEKLLPYRSIWIAVFSCFLGSILYRFFIATALHSEFLGLESQDLNLITGLLVIGVMLLPRRQKC